jgi:hypothetical protein
VEFESCNMSALDESTSGIMLHEHWDMRARTEHCAAGARTWDMSPRGIKRILVQGHEPESNAVRQERVGHEPEGN